MAVPFIVLVGSDGELGRLVHAHLEARGLELRCPEPAPERSLPELAHADVVVNLAGPRVRPGLDWPDYFREHVGTAQLVARSMRPGSHLIHFSSASVYGGGRGGIIDATTPEAPLLFPSPSYACAKLAAELCVRTLGRERGLGVSILRPPFIYGPGVGSAIESFLALARRHIHLQLRPESSRQHILHIRLLLAALDALIAAGPHADGPIVLADPFVLTNADLNRAVRESGAGIPVPLPLSAAQF